MTADGPSNYYGVIFNTRFEVFWLYLVNVSEMKSLIKKTTTM